METEVLREDQLTAREAAPLLSVSLTEVYQLAAAHLATRYIGRGTRKVPIRVGSLRAYVDSLPADPVAEA